MNKSAYKVFMLCIMLVLFIPLTIAIYFGLYSINNFFPQTYQRYATGGRADTNIFFNSEINESTKVIDSISIVDLSEVKADRRIQTFCKVINKNKYKIKKSIMANKLYMEYLDKNELTVDDFFSYSEKIASLDDNFVKSGFFISALIIIYICVVKFNWRNKFYWFAGLVYILDVLSQFTGMQIDNLAYYAIIQKYETYDNYISTVPLLLDAIVQSVLAFIIFDYLLQKYRKKRSIVVDNLITDINSIIDKIESRTITPSEISSSWKVIIFKFLKVCRKFIPNYKRKKFFDKIFRQMTNSDEELYALINSIQKEIEDVSSCNTTNINGYGKKLKMLRAKIYQLKKYDF
ncbi:hypothetical protein [Clostridium sp. 'White wine YQ']|uniref:hypothetical protein n=1 Tax=Clostridium sp. 'White wine YQ' TaxID=3027474 RepID=UPI002365EF88|nr:hypothetical protein [Clostridium sp. 'White wine YQ']MDD7795908.1 hypothetical protein [Clostridium sp. 'White wine YQ']